jgi:hypothetical protein
MVSIECGAEVLFVTISTVKIRCDISSRTVRTDISCRALSVVREGEKKEN